jgi:hypothetical protein
LKVAASRAQTRAVKRIDTMDNRTPELAQHWSANAAAAASNQSKRDEDARAEAAKLEQLADRVSAARSVY